MSSDMSGDGASLPDSSQVLVEDSRARLEQRRAEAEIEFHRNYERLITAGDNTDAEVEMLIVQYASARFFAFAKEALKVRVDTATARQLIDKSLAALIDRAFVTKNLAASKADGAEQQIRFHNFARFMITHSDEWLELQEGFLDRAKLEQEAMAAVRDMVLTTVPATSSAEEPKAGAVVATPPTKAERRPRRGRPRLTVNEHPEVDVYLEDVSKFAKSAQNPQPGLRRDITITDFCIVSGFGDDTIFGAWRRGDTTRCHQTHVQKFQETLQLSPVQFLGRLDKTCDG